MYGFGSKKALLEDFASSALTDGPVMVVNGYLPAVNVKRVSAHIQPFAKSNQLHVL